MKLALIFVALLVAVATAVETTRTRSSFRGRQLDGFADDEFADADDMVEYEDEEMMDDAWEGGDDAIADEADDDAWDGDDEDADGDDEPLNEDEWDGDDESLEMVEEDFDDDEFDDENEWDKVEGDWNGYEEGS